MTRALFLPKKRKFFFDASCCDLWDYLSVNQNLLIISFHLQSLFSNKSIASVVSKFLKPSDLRSLIVVLQLIEYPVSMYFEHLCRYFLPPDKLKNILAEYIGTMSLSKVKKKVQHWSIPFNQRESQHGFENQPDVQFICTTFNSSVNSETSETLPYELIYKMEIFGRYCDECRQILNEVQLIKPRLVKIKRSHIKRKREKEEFIVEQKDHDKCHKSTHERKKRYAVIDESLTQIILCDECLNNFTSRDTIEPLLYQISSDAFLLQGVCQFVSLNVSQLTFDHGGTLILTSLWNTFYQKFTQAKDQLQNTFRQGFAKRMAKKFGQCFYHQFIYKILPTSRFLEIDAKQRTYNPIPWVSRTLALGKRRSRFQNGPLIERYPLGSLERSTAYQISQDFQVWSSHESLHRLMSAEAHMINVFTLALNVLQHPDYRKAASLVDDYVLTRQIDREKFDHIYLSCLWRVLHRGSTREKRSFTGCIYDRQRIDKFFSACCITRKPPVLPVKGYLGFESIQESTEQASPLKRLETNNS